MKKRIAFIIAIVLIQATAFLQDNLPVFKGEISWSEYNSVSLRTQAPEIIGQTNGAVFLIRSIKKKKYIEKYDIRTLRLINSTELELEFNKKDLLLKGQTMFNKGPLIQTSFYNKKTDITYNFLQKINKNTLAVSDPIPITQTKTPKAKGVMGAIEMSGMTASGELAEDLLTSENNTLGFVTEVQYADQIKKNDPLEIISMKGKLFDEDLTIIAENEYELPYNEFTIFQERLGNDGLIYFAGYETETTVDTKGIIKREETIYGDLEILVLELESGEIEALKVSTNNKEVKNFTFRINEENGEIIVSGLIGDEDGGVSGGFYARYNSLLQEQSMNFVDFEQDFITQGWSEKSKKKLEKKQEKQNNRGKEKKKPDFYKYRIRDLIVKPDGTSTLLAEQYYVRVVTRTTTGANGQMQTTTTYYYYYNDVIALNFDSNGELIWKSLIEKTQVSINDGGYYSSFFTVLEGNDISIIYNEHENKTVDTEGMSRAEKNKLKRKYVVARVILDEEGEQYKEKLFDFEKTSMRLVPKACGAASKELVFLYARSFLGEKMGLIEWD